MLEVNQGNGEERSTTDTIALDYTIDQGVIVLSHGLMTDHRLLVASVLVRL